MRKGILFAVVTLLLLLILFQVVMAVDSEEQVNDFADELQAAIEKMDPENELVDQRSKFRRSFRDNQGKIVTFIATCPLNYLGRTINTIRLKPI